MRFPSDGSERYKGRAPVIRQKTFPSESSGLQNGAFLGAHSVTSHEEHVST